MTRLECAATHIAAVGESAAALLALLDERQARREALRPMVRGEG